MSDRGTLPWLVVGAGYAGARFAREAAQRGERVWATVRHVEQAIALEHHGVSAIVVDVTSPPPLPRLATPLPCIAILSIPPARMDDEGDRETSAVCWAKEQGAVRLVYWSSTSVYGASGGDTVDETTSTAPDTRVGRRRYAAEQRVVAAAEACGIPLSIVRIVGIYGPHRNMRQRLEAGDYVMADDGMVWSNRVHVDDIVGATRWICAADEPEGVWLLSDGAPFYVADFVRWLTQTLGLPMAGSVPLASMDVRRQSFWTGNRRTRPARLLASGWQPQYPCLHEGMRACWREEQGDAIQDAAIERAAVHGGPVQSDAVHEAAVDRDTGQGDTVLGDTVKDDAIQRGEGPGEPQK